MEQLSQSWSDVASDGVTSSLLASFGTGLGALPVLFTARLNQRWQTLLLSVGSGVMLAAAAFSLFLPALRLINQTTGGNWWMGMSAIAAATITGAGLFYGLAKVLPEESAPEPQSQLRHVWLFVLAIALHHFPEGLAVGLGTESTHDASIAIGVALQNLPEGLMVALALRQIGYSAGFALMLATISGWLEPFGGLLGATLVDLGTVIAPVGMALAAGAMLFVVSHELLYKLSLNTLNSRVGMVTGLVMMGVVEQLC